MSYYSDDSFDHAQLHEDEDQMTNLKAVTQGMNRFCGPAVLSILTGKSTDECANVIRRINGQYNIKGVLLTDLLMACDKLGFDQKRIEVEGSLYKVLTAICKQNGMYIFMVPNHFVCIEVREGEIYFCDNHTKEPMKAASSARLMQNVTAVYQVIERKKSEEEIAREKFSKLLDEMRIAQARFITHTQTTANQVIIRAREISGTLGNTTSHEECVEAIIKEFADRMRGYL